MQAFKISMIKNVQAVSLPQPISFFISFEVNFTHSVVYAEATFGVLRQGDLNLFMKPMHKISSWFFAFNCLHPQHCAIFPVNVSIRPH